METIRISEFKAKCLAILSRVERARTPVLITRWGKEIARILPPETQERKSWLGSMAGTARISGDIVNPDPADEKLWTKGS